MDQERQRIQADLRGLVEGDVRCDDLFVQMYAGDASIYEIRPLGVVRPRGVRDVVACVQYAAENNIPVHARGAGSGLAGESLGPGLILDFSHSMRRVLDVDAETVRVQPGVVHAQLNRHLEKGGRLFGPDPATRSVTTMGSVLALDASGSHWPRYGSARGTVESLQVVTADGHVLDIGKHKVAAVGHDHSKRQLLVHRLADLIERNQPLIAQHTPKTAVHRCGYHLQGVLKDGELDLARLLVGSEGTLALITEARVRTEPLPRHRAVVLLFFDRLESAARGALEAAEEKISACDLMDRRLLTIAREQDVRYDLLIPAQAEAMLLVELEGDDEQELRGRINHLVVRLQRRKKLAFDARTTMEVEERNLYWRLTRRVIPRLYRLAGSTRPLPFVEDMAVPPKQLPGFLVRLQNVLKSHQVTASLFAHASHGQLHLRPFLDMANSEDVRRIQELATALYEEVLDVGGTISGEHGAGLSRTWFIRQQFGPMYSVLREVKRIFDPQNILNPGKVIADAPQPPTKNLRPVSVAVETRQPDEAGAVAPVNEDQAQPQQTVNLQLVWKGPDIGYMARMCNGCARCRTQSPDERMCPIFRYAPSEEASPRAKANLMRAVLTGQVAPDALASETMHEIAKLCVNCHQCRLECPATVDIPKLMIEAKGQYVATNGLGVFDYNLANIDRLASWGSRVSPFANWAIASRQARWVIEKTFGIAQGRKLPRFAARPLLRVASRRRLTRSTRQSGRKVLYFVDIYANWFDVELGEALLAVAQHNGISVFVPPEQLPSGMNRLSLGDVEGARKQASRNVSLLVEAVRQGYHIVASEPSATLCLSHEYPNLLDDEDARLVARNTSEACTYLWKMHQQGELELDFRPLNATVAYHEPCHMRALQVGTPGLNLLRLIPGLNVRLIDRGCSGMAGMYGLKRENFRTSLRAGWGVVSAMREPSFQVGATECSACKMQMEQGTTKPTIHPLKLLALSYGILPLGHLLTGRSEELVVT